MTIKEKYEAALKAIRDTQAAAKAQGRVLTDDETKFVDGKLDEAEALKADLDTAAEQKARFDRLAALDPGDAKNSTGDDGGQKSSPRSLGDHFVSFMAEKGITSLKGRGTLEAPEFKAATDTQMVGTAGLSGAFGPLLTDVDRSGVWPKRERLVVADLLASGSLAGNAITYPVYGALEGGTATVAEGAAKSQLHLPDPTWKTDALSEIAGWFKMSDLMAEDLDFIVSEINSAAVYDLALKEEQQLLGGDGVSPNLRGLLNRSGIQTATKGADTSVDAILKSINKVQTATGFAADGVVINPTDYEAIRLLKDANGQYLAGGPFTGAYGQGGVILEPPIWGRRTIVTTAITAGSCLVGAFGTAKVFRKGGVRVESTNSNENDFVTDKITVRLRERLALQVKYPAAFVKLNLAA